jgi:hypothetical protein
MSVVAARRMVSRLQQNRVPKLLTRRVPRLTARRRGLMVRENVGNRESLPAPA